MNKNKKSKVNAYKSISYCVVSSYADDLTDFTEFISNLINDEGWSIAGNISASNSMLYQSLTKHEK